MGKRSDYERKERDFYPTPMEAFLPLLPHLPYNFTYIEPCAGDGALVNHISSRCNGATCIQASDIEPQESWIEKEDMFNVLAHQTIQNIPSTQYLITNPQCDRTILHRILDTFQKKIETWLLFDADWIHTKQSIQFQHMLRSVVSVGRVKWIPDSKSVGKDNCCWYYFDDRPSHKREHVKFKAGDIHFYGRREN